MMVAASAAFASAPTPPIAAEVVGAMLTRWHYIALTCPLVLFALELKRVRALVLALLFTGVVLAALQGFADIRIRAIRESSEVPISYLSKSNPLRRQFGILHGISSGLLMLQMVVAAGVVMARPRRGTRQRDRGPVREEESSEANDASVGPTPAE